MDKGRDRLSLGAFACRLLIAPRGVGFNARQQAKSNRVAGLVRRHATAFDDFARVA
jgi:hypothetical protein